MKLTRKLSAAVPFAHLLGIRAETEDDDRRDSDPAAEDDERKQREGESDEDYAKRMEELDEKEQAESEKDEEQAESGDEPDGDEEEDDDEPKAAARAERARCARIIAHGIKHGCVHAAAVFAFDTGMSVAQAVSALNASGRDASASKRGGLGSRMAAITVPKVSADAAPAPDMSDPKAAAAATAKMIIAAAAKARGEAA